LIHFYKSNLMNHDRCLHQPKMVIKYEKGGGQTLLDVTVLN